MLYLAGVNKHAGLRVVVGDQWGAPAGVDEPNIAANGGKVEMSTFNHPWSELDDLFRREKSSEQ